MNYDSNMERRSKVLQMLWDSWTSFDQQGHTTIQQLMVSRREVAEYLPCSKTLASHILDDLVADGLMRKERYMLTKNPIDQRWQWLYSVTPSGVEAIEMSVINGQFS